MAIKELREKKQWSQSQLGKKLNVSQQTIHRWETYSARPNYEKLLELSKVLCVSANTLIKEFANFKD